MEADSLAEGLAAIPFGDDFRWVVKTDREEVRAVQRWLDGFGQTTAYDSLMHRFFNGYNPYRKTPRDEKIISPYDDLLKKYAPVSGWDWKLLAAVMWQESKFRIQAVSPRGAGGLMQFMPRTARRYGIRNILDPEESIRAGAKFLARLQGLFRPYAADEEELVKFALAAYNAGEGRFLGCIEAAQAHGFGSDTWDKLSHFLEQAGQDSLLLVPVVRDSTLFDDEEDVPRTNYLGAETVAYVGAILARYDLFRGVAPAIPLPEDVTEEMLEVADSLLGADGTGRVDLGDEKTGDEEEQQDDGEGQDVGNEDPGEVDVDRNE